MPSKAMKHFQDDISRALNLMNVANSMNNGRIKDDIFRSAWMFAVGALDAYMCDAYSDLVASSLIAKNKSPVVIVPDFLKSIAIPVAVTLESYAKRENWKWRNAANRMMDDKNILSLSEIQKRFNPFLQDGKKLHGDVVLLWVFSTTDPKRVFGIKKAEQNTLRKTKAADQNKLKFPRKVNNGTTTKDIGIIQILNAGLNERFTDIFQRRHDCIHNCDRPKRSVQPISFVTVQEIIDDIRFYVKSFDNHIEQEFREFLKRCKVPQTTMRAVGYAPTP